MWMAAEVIRGNIACDHHHGDRVEGGVCDTCGGVGEPGPQVRHQHTRFSGCARITIGSMCGDLLMAGGNIADLLAVADGIEEPDHGMASQTKDDLNAELFKILNQLIGGKTHF